MKLNKAKAETSMRIFADNFLNPYLENVIKYELTNSFDKKGRFDFKKLFVLSNKRVNNDLNKNNCSS